MASYPFVLLEKNTDHSTIFPEPESECYSGLECLVELKPEEPLTGIQFRDCLIDYSVCPNRHCIKKLV